MGIPLFGSLVKSKFDFKSLVPDFIGESDGPIDPRKRLTKEDVAKRRKGKKNRRKFGEFENLKPGQELEIRGFNELQEGRRRAKGVNESLQAQAEQRGLGKALTKADEDTDASFANVEGQLARRQKGLGLRLSERQRRGQTKQLGLARNLARAESRGTTRRGFASRASGVAEAAGGIENEIFGAENASLTRLSVAAAESDKQATKMINKREKDRAGFAGGIVGTVASFFSSEELKHDHGHEPKLLEKLKKVRINRWQYKGDDKTHVGPFSEEFNREFGIETDRPDMINVIDALGVTLGAVKELSEQVNG